VGAFFRRRWQWVLGMALACALLLDSPRWRSYPQPKITLAAFDQLRPGMTQADVENVLGYPRFDPSRRYQPREIKIWDGAPEPDEVEKGWRMNWWGEGEWVVQVFFEKNGKAFRAEFLHVSTRDWKPQQVIADLRKIFGL
jgi:hypothetical protein